MKTSIVAFMCAVAVPFMSAVAQITLDTNDVKANFAVGKSWTQYTDTLMTSVDVGTPSPTVANIWNFSALGLHSPQVLTSVSIVGAPHVGDFPGATHALLGISPVSIVINGIGTVNATVTLHQYLKLAGDLFNPGNWGSAVGTISGIPATGEVKTSMIPSAELVYKLPATMGTTWTSSQTSIQVVDVLTPIPIPGAVKDTTSHNARYVVDAFGMMTLPGPSTHQALRLRRVDRIKKNSNPESGVLSFIFITKNGASANFTVCDTTLTSGIVPLCGSTQWNGPLPTDVRISENIPTEFALKQNYPNPFNPSTTINYQVASDGFVSLGVYNLLGQQVTTLVNEVKAPGEYAAEWNAEGMPSGVYFYRLQAGNFVASKKLLLLK